MTVGWGVVLFNFVIYVFETNCLEVFYFVFGLFETRSRYVAQLDLKFVILLLQPPQCWD